MEAIGWVGKQEASPLCLCKVAPVAQMSFCSCSPQLLGVADALWREELLFGRALSRTAELGAGQGGAGPGTTEALACCK